MPIRRDELLAPLSREHHQGLLLCWKIRTGFRKSVDLSRIQNYAEWFYKSHLMPHFEIEEKYVFSVLGNNHDLVRRALKEHRQLRRLFNRIKTDQKSIGLIEEKLEAHIRFEERVLFNEIQAVASPDELQEISIRHSGQGELIDGADWTDEFWR